MWKKINVTDLLSERELRYEGNKFLQKSINDQNRSTRPKPESKPSGSRKSELEQQFAQNIERLEQSIGGLEFREKSMATEWIAKLKVQTKDASEIEARNFILDRLLKCAHEKVFSTEPFNKPPPQNNFKSIKDLLPPANTACMSPNQEEKLKHLKELYNDSYDNGEFLSQLPVPRNGAFFVLHLRPNI